MTPEIGLVVVYHDMSSGRVPAIITSVEMRRFRDEFEQRAVERNKRDEESSYDVRLTAFFSGSTVPLGVVPFGKPEEAGHWSWDKNGY